MATLGPATDTEPALRDLIAAARTWSASIFPTEVSTSMRVASGRRARRPRRPAASSAFSATCAARKCASSDSRPGSATLVEGETFTLDPAFDPADGTDRIVGVAYESLPRDVRTGDTLLLNDGLISLEVTGVEGTKVNTRVLTGGELTDKKGLNKLGGGLSAGALTAKDRDDIRMAAELGVDYLAVSFVRDKSDVAEAWDLLRAAKGEGRIVAKIERREAIDNLESIIETTAAVMVARGDLGVEVGYAELTGLQKHIIALARAKSRLVITATQMMESMIHAPVPTRAEVSDVANAVMDDTDAVMLSAETAVGRHPGRVVRAMSQVIEGAEKWQLSNRPELRADGHFVRTDEAIAAAVMYTANHLEVRAIVALTESGSVGALDVAHPLRHPDLRLYPPRGDTAARDALPGSLPGRFRRDAPAAGAHVRRDLRARACRRTRRRGRPHHRDEGRILRRFGRHELDEDRQGPAPKHVKETARGTLPFVAANPSAR